MNDVKEIEKSIIKKFRSKIYKKFVHAVKDFELIKENDKICCCISGGKDSFLLAKCMQELQIHSKYYFELKYIVMDPGYKKENLDKVKKVMPAMTGPTISEVLSKEETVAVQAVIDEDVVFELVNDLRNAGAKDILVVPIERII